ncbi:MAG: 2-oxo acid dehydrogenase subunit E2 [Phycisphaerae bacterium]|jgi:pyruvate dehydrogenase E2 component (dihydrolipoamide acetyltransferase)
MFEIKMPKAGQSMEDGTIVKWRKAEGQAVAEGEVLLEVETDKATIEVESTHSGTLRKILVPEGETVPVHTPVALIGQPDEAIVLGASVSPIPEHAKPQAAASDTQKTAAPAPAAPAHPPAGVVPILMPKAGQSVEEAEIVAWHVKVGDRIKAGDIIFDVETDKATIEVEATDAGRISRIVLNAGETAAVLQPVAYLAEDDAAVDAYLASAPSAAKPASGPTNAAPQAAAATAAVGEVSAQAPAVTSGGRVKASPAARKLADQRGIDLSAVGAGKGPGGRILSSDVPTQAPARVAPVSGEVVRRRMSPMRKAIARNLLASKQNIPHFYMRATVDAEPMMAFYRSAKAKFACSVNDVVTAACARAIAEFPAFRSRVDKDEIVEFPGANIGIAVGMDDGLVVPVIVAAETMGLQALAARTRQIAESARKGKIEGLGQGVFTITNLGMFGVEEFAAIINPPEASILAVGAVREDVIVSGGAMRPGKVMTMTLSADHRLIDGLLAARFMARLKEILLAPEQLEQ